MKLAHIGYVVESIDNYLAKSFLRSSTQPVHDPVQKSRVCFVDIGRGDEVLLELIEPAEPDSAVANFIDTTGGGLHHLCFEVEDLAEAENTATRERMIPVLGPCPATAFGGRRVVFYYSRNHEIIEFLEIGKR